MFFLGLGTFILAAFIMLVCLVLVAWQLVHKHLAI